MNVHIPKVICWDCKKNMMLKEGTTRRVCGWCNREVTIEVIEE